jgi:DNA-binding NarL/FixJ family response regulator
MSTPTLDPDHSDFDLADPARVIRVVLVDGDDRIRETLCGVLSIGDHVTLVGATGEPADAIDLIRDGRPDLVIVDIRISETPAGAAFIAAVHDRWPAVRILAMGIAATAVHVAELGADGFVRKSFRPTDMVPAILAAAAGRRP